ncbi:MAG: hypothetical protein ACI97A_004270 [Planctomycetota bacterium]|jgi:hypothetical protein
MPNGHDKNWVRFCAAVDGFKARHGKWPVRVALDQGYIDGFEMLFATDDLQTIRSKVELTPRADAHMIAEDDDGNEYNYAEEGFADVRHEASAEVWFRVEPRHDHD